MAEIAQDHSGVTVRPAPLSSEAAARLVAERLGEDPDPSFIGACHDATGGNPLLLGQLLRSLSDDAVRPDAASAPVVCEIGPRAISRTVLLRLARLPPDATPTARALAVLGQGADLPTAAALAELDERRAGEAIGALARAEILLPDPSLGFVHPVVREAVYRDMDVGTRERLHRAAARRLSSAGAAPERVAAQLMLVSPRGDPGVVSVLRAAAASASARGAPETATSLLRRAVDEPPEPGMRAELLLELGLVESQVDAAAGVARLREADATLTDPATRLRLARPLAWGLIFTGHPQEAADRARAAAESMPPEMDDLRRWLTAIELCSVVFGADVPGAPSRLAAERFTPPGGGPGARALQCYASFDWCVHGGSVADVAPLAAGALEGGVLLAEPDGFMLGAGALLALEMAESPEADEAWDAALAQAHRNGSLFAISTILLWRGLGLLWRGDMREARTHLEDAQAMLARWGMTSETHPRIFLAELLTSTGALREARAALPAQSGWSELADPSLFRLRAEAGLLLAEGRDAEALETCERLAACLGARGTAEVMNPAWIPWRSLTARALDGIGRRDEARDLLHAELALARTWGAPGPIGRTLRWIGELERDDGLAALEEAAAVLERSTARREHALALASLGAALRRARRPSDAREPLRRALELADACGADPLLVERVRSELAAAGARPRATALSGPGALTPSERRAAAMAAEGMSNRGIAEALYVTPKTVELHLSSAYRKLGVRSRRELPEALRALLSPRPRWITRAARGGCRGSGRTGRRGPSPSSAAPTWRRRRSRWRRPAPRRSSGTRRRGRAASAPPPPASAAPMTSCARLVRRDAEREHADLARAGSPGPRRPA